MDMFRRAGRRRRPPMRAPIVTYKHQKNEDITYVGGNANNETILYTGLPPGNLSLVNGVPAGHKVFSVDVSVNALAPDNNTTGTFSWMLIHLRADQSVATLINPSRASGWSEIGLSVGRNQVIKSYMGLYGTDDAGPYRSNVHIKIPKLWHRVREGDQLILVWNSDAATTFSVGFRYKDYS